MNRVIGLMFCLFAVLMSIHITASASRVSNTMDLEIGPIPVPDTGPYTAEQVRKAIIYGAMGNHWTVESETSGLIKIKQDGRNDQIVLVMDVLYDANGYSLKYVSRDVPQKYQHKFGSIYSRWTKGLIARINRELSAANL